jgi:hypothetical protein
MTEMICDVRWEGPVDWDRRADLLALDHVLYALYGTHQLYGHHVLLYLGMTEIDLGTRLAGHVQWVADEYEPMRLKAASVGRFATVDEWWNSYDPKERYKRGDPKLVVEVESLLIYAHQPAYNTQCKNGLRPNYRPLRVFNTGRFGNLLPEVSTAYYQD